MENANSEEYWRSLLENLPYAVIVHDGERILFANRAAGNLGCVSNPSELIGRPVFSIIHSDYHGFAAQRIAQVFKQGAKASVAEEKVILPDGSLLDMEVSASGIEFNGRPAVLTIANDISQRKKIEKERYLSEEKYRRLFNNTSDIILIHTLNEEYMPGKFIEVNDTACRRLEYSREELLSMSPQDIDAKEMYHKIPEKAKKLKESGHAVIETINVTKTGRRTPVEVSTRVFVINGEKFGISIVRDITERKVMEDELKESEERYKKLVELSPDAVFLIRDYKIEYANLTGAKLLGAKSAEGLLGMPILQFVHPDYREAAKNRMHQIEDYGPTVPSKKFKIIRLDGTTVDVESVATSVMFKGKRYLLSYNRDISDRKRIAELEKSVYEKERMLLEAEQYERIRSEFFANLSHEFRTPINMVFASTQLLEKCLGDGPEGLTPEGLKKHLKIMKQNIYRLIRLTNNLIDITKIEAEYFGLCITSCDIVRVVEDITLSAVEYTKCKGIELVFDTDVEEKVTACDPDMIERVVLNLLSNAIKFTGQGGTVSVCLHDLGKYIRISVKDTGIGIPPEKIDIVFDRFRQVDQSLSRNFEGSGIGLSLAKSLVELHNGRIWVESEYGSGSEFYVELPVKEAADADRSDWFIKNGKEIKTERIKIEFSDIYS